jgi:SAM-dependent methyltransferase
MGRKRLLPGLTVKDGFMRHPFDAEHHVQTSGLVPGRHLSIGHPNDPHSTAYYGIAPSVFQELLAIWRPMRLHGPLSRYTFIDFGAGMGRAMLLASRLPFAEVVGVESHPDLAAIARKNILRWQADGRARCPLRILRQDALEFQFPANPCVAYLFNPFRVPVLQALRDKMENDFATRPGQLDLLYANHEFEDLFRLSHRWSALWAHDIRLSLEDEQADRAILNNQPDGEYASTVEEPCSIYRCIAQPPPLAA